jgi:protein TonB
LRAPRWFTSAAIAIAANRPVVLQPIVNAPDGIDVIVVPDSPQPAAPPELVGAPPPPPPPATSEETFPEERATPPPVRRVERQAPPLRRASAAGHAGPINMSVAKALAVNAPRPEYPYEARRQRITGSGVALLTVDGGGIVTSVTMLRSTGNAILDQATISGLRRWRFKPGTVSTVQTPVTYTLAGGSY